VLKKKKKIHKKKKKNTQKKKKKKKKNIQNENFNKMKINNNKCEVQA
jgi:hypothetical protein